ncbi:hypothetical protein S4A8_16752 [Salinisphaera sp. S4-8]|uniref:hypothetical protein n=1 Tax=Salinisphaera sp. S4-8 TaxID=633357 RepID=UPI0033418ED8
MDKHETRIPTAPLLRSSLALALMLAPFAAAQAYVGPGAGLSLLGALWGVVAAIGAALLFVVLWPIRRMRRRKKAEAAARSEQATASTHGNEAGNGPGRS